nr:hypothetical protein [uncultured Mediterranean phage uvMED]
MTTKTTKETMSKNKIAFNDIESGTMQDITRNFIDKHIFACQSYLVSELMSKEVISIEDYINFYKSDETIKSEYDVTTEEEIQEVRDNGEDHQEVFEHWLCSDWFINQMKNQDEPILETDLGAWWGRTCTNQAINLDYNVQELAYQYSHDERLYKKKVA